MPRLRQVPRAEADPFAQQLYQVLFGDRDPVKEPGTATGTTRPPGWLMRTVCRIMSSTVAG